MTELDRLGNSENFNFSGGRGGGSSFLQVCEMRLQETRKKMEYLHSDGFGTYGSSKSLGVKLPVCPVNENKNLIPIKL